MIRKDVLEGFKNWKGSDKRATTPEQKAEILHRLLQLWRDNPQLRFVQMIGNVLPIDAYYKEDYDFINDLESYYNEAKSQRLL